MELKINFAFLHLKNIFLKFSIYCQAITKLKILAHRLPVETCRYINVAYRHRAKLQEYCDINEVGNEQHFLTSCTKTQSSLRQIHFY